MASAKFRGIKVRALVNLVEKHNLWQEQRELTNPKGIYRFAEEFCHNAGMAVVESLPAADCSETFAFVSFPIQVPFADVVSLISELLSEDDAVFLDPFCRNTSIDQSVEQLIKTDLKKVLAQSTAILMVASVSRYLATLPSDRLLAIANKHESLDEETMKLTPFLRLWCIAELLFAAALKIPTVVTFGSAYRNGAGHWHFRRVHCAQVVDALSANATLDGAHCTADSDRKIIHESLLREENLLAAFSDSSQQDLKETVNSLLQSVIRGALFAQEWPEVQAAACSSQVTPMAAEMLACAFNSNGQTALMAACAAGYFVVVEALLKAHADPTVVDQSGRTALAYAESCPDHRVFQEVLRYGRTKSRSMSISSIPPWYLDEGNESYQVFLSHRQQDAKDFARALHAHLTLRGVRTFLDMEYKGELNDLEAIVATCPNFIYVLSDTIFESEWCTKELISAVRNHKNIILIVKEHSRWGDDRNASFPPHSLIQTLPEEVHAAFTTKAVEHSDYYYQAFLDQLFKRVKLEELATSEHPEFLPQYSPSECNGLGLTATPITGKNVDHLAAELAEMRKEITSELLAIRTEQAAGSRTSCGTGTSCVIN